MSWDRDPDARARDQAKLRNLLKTGLPRFRILAARVFREERNSVLAGLERDGTSNIDQIVHGAQEWQHRAWMAFYRQLYAVIGAQTMLDGIPPGDKRSARARRADDQGGIGVAWGAPDDDWWTDFFRPRLPGEDWVDTWLHSTLRYAETEGSKKVRLVNAATRRRIQIQVHVSQAKGESVTDLIKRIDRLYLDSIIPNRSEVIARTELLTAARAGDHNATLATGYGDSILKSWLTSGQSDRTRDSHLAAEASEIDIPFQEPFRVGGSKLMFPGDTSLGADSGETIQCMCSELKRLPL